MTGAGPTALAPAGGGDPTLAGISRRGLRLAGVWTLLGAVAEAPHILEDAGAGVGATLGLRPQVVGALGLALVAVGMAGAVSALLGRRPAARILLVVAGLWTVGVLADHAGGLVHPLSFRAGLTSSLALYGILVANLLAAAYALAPALSPALDAVKLDGMAAWREADAGRMILLDVRTATERRQGRIPSSVADVRRLRRGVPVAVVCSHGGRSLFAARRLRSRGFTARSVAGGTRAWQRAGLPWTR